VVSPERPVSRSGHGGLSGYFVTLDQEHASMRRRQPGLQRLLIVLGSIPSPRRIGGWKFDDENPFGHWIAFQHIDPAAAGHDPPAKTGNCR